MKIVTIAGGRPQFIKLAAVSRTLRKSIDEILIHTGQHYDANMSALFFEELDIPQPDYNLGIAGGTHGEMTGKMLSAIEEVLIKERPDSVLVYGDMNSTLAGALAAVKLLIPVCHVEAGPRLGTLSNPEEVNRICTDHISSLLLCGTKSALDFCAKEGLLDRAILVGDPMYDAFKHYSSKSENVNLEEMGISGEFYYLTCHRQENADVKSLTAVLDTANSLDRPTIYPVHPRNRQIVQDICMNNNFHHVRTIPPVGYLTSIALVNKAKKVITDSGGLSREAFFAEKKCVMLMDYVACPEIMEGNRTQLAKCEKNDILEKLETPMTIGNDYQPFGDGNSADKISESIKEMKNRFKYEKLL